MATTYFRADEHPWPIHHVFNPRGYRPLQKDYPCVEEILERNRPAGKLDRGTSVYCKTDRNFDRVGIPLFTVFIHTVEPSADVERRDLEWTGVLQGRFPKVGERNAQRYQELDDDEVAAKWWAGEPTESPNWEWVCSSAKVVAVDEKPTEIGLRDPSKFAMHLETDEGLTPLDEGPLDLDALFPPPDGKPQA